MNLYDAHNHFQDDRLRPHEAGIIVAAQQSGVVKMIVNGSCEADWPQVLDLAKRQPNLVIPSFGLHPWHVSERTKGWKTTLIRFLDQTPSGVGEIGLDKWILERPKARESPKSKVQSPKSERRGMDHSIGEVSPAPMEEQEEVFAWQLRLAAERNLPASIHCLKAWGRLLAILKHEPKPTCGFILHSFGGPKEMIGELTDLGAYFSLPGYFAHENKERQREAFRHVPLDRLLIETDAPDQCLPETKVQFPLADERGNALNHPANLGAVYEFAAELRGISAKHLAESVEANFHRVFRLD